MPDLPDWTPPSPQSPVDLITIAANPALRNYLLKGDANPTFQVNGDGKLQWGAGGASALDTTLFRLAGGILSCGATALRADGLQSMHGATAVADFGFSAANQIGFFGHAVSPQLVLATGAGHTVDDVITALQTYGLVKQA